MDTEFPGTVFHPDGVPVHLRSTLPPTSFYRVMKKNIDALNLIQIGLTLSDADGNLPTFGTRSQFVWEFNFRDFDYESDLQNPDSISLLERQGIDFLKNKRIGIDSRHFAMLFGASGLGPSSFYGRVMWVTFHGHYDFGFLIKILVKGFFGPFVFDVKNMIRLFGLHGGLDRVAESLSLERLAGKSHQAGSDSLLTMHVFLSLRKRCLKDNTMDSMVKLNHCVYGLTTVS
ncbi:probable ccr4-associated factor 1 homolog 11 [Phtheirospermum japonicum]|uniref:Probable ccr4-associated factor 1 homolog 11 n=1 Tax=Phtheirospermum japonicum TaxID=374723 RepID=A0A830DCN3_9LAMI|nr:probable ccr4-associated factor 1 homolog 11 [Phtheirospermum japonicum]